LLGCINRRWEVSKLDALFRQFEDLRDDIKVLVEEMQKLNSNIEEVSRMNENLEELNSNLEDFMGGLKELEE